MRLAVSVKIAIDSDTLTIAFKEAYSVIVNGYRDTLKAEGCPFVLAEQERNLERLGIKEIVPPKRLLAKAESAAFHSTKLYPALQGYVFED